MSSAFVQGAAGSVVTSGTTATVSLTGVTAGNCLVISTRYASQNRNVSGISGGGTWSIIGAKVLGTNYSTECWVCPNTSSGDITFTVTYDFSITAAHVIVAEYSGIVTTSPIDQSARANASTSSLAVGPITPTGDGRRIVSAGSHLTDSQTLATPSGFTQRVFVSTGLSTGGHMLVDLRQASAGSQDVTWILTPSGSQMHGHLFALVEESAPPPPPVPSRITLSFRPPA
jgi:hypothetical protein